MTDVSLPATFDPAAWIAPGEMLLGKYTLIESIAEGRISVILKVRDASNCDLVAKTIKPAIRSISTPQQLSALMAVGVRESSLQAAFHHPNIIRIVECGLDPHLGVCTVMEYAPLGTLRQRISAACLDLSQSMQIIDALFSALLHMHTPTPLHPLGVAHLDMEPKNIVFGSGDVPKICDFHYARRISLEFAPAEYIDKNHPIDIRTDLLQVGKMFMEMISSLGSEPLPRPLKDYISELTAPDPRQRFQSAFEARQALEGLR
jgi:hypothetical protein